MGRQQGNKIAKLKFIQMFRIFLILIIKISQLRSMNIYFCFQFNIRNVSFLYKSFGLYCSNVHFLLIENSRDFLVFWLGIFSVKDTRLEYLNE